MMPKRFTAAFLVALVPTSGLSVGVGPALAQGATPSLPGAPQPTPSYPSGQRLPQGPQGGSGNYAVSAAANEHAAFLWVVDNVQRAVVLCEKPDGRDFTCTKKPLP
jgi:hypothetical protein